MIKIQKILIQGGGIQVSVLKFGGVIAGDNRIEQLSQDLESCILTTKLIPCLWIWTGLNRRLLK